jgi:hypothetical protein
MIIKVYGYLEYQIYQIADEFNVSEENIVRIARGGVIILID